MIPPLAFYNLVTQVGQCAVDRIAELTPTPELSRVCLLVPGDIAWDDCQCGSFTQTAGPWLWSNNGRVTTGYIGDANNCGPHYLGIEVTAEVLRCVAQPVGDALAPTCEALLLDRQQLDTDAAAIRNGIICCLQTLLADEGIESFEIMSHTPIGPQGGCVGSQVKYRIWLGNCECP